MKSLASYLLLLISGAGAAECAEPYQPLSASERWKRYAMTTVASPGFYLSAAGSAIGAQWRDKPPEWEQGMTGYGKRAASQLGRFGIQATVHQGLSAAAGTDPRYLRCECKGFGPRFGHALKWTFLTKNREGQTRFDAPALAGYYGGGMLSMYWHPSRYDPLTDGVREGTQQVGFAMGINVLREFGPELKRWIRRGR